MKNLNNNELQKITGGTVRFFDKQYITPYETMDPSKSYDDSSNKKNIPAIIGSAIGGILTISVLAVQTYKYKQYRNKNCVEVEGKYLNKKELDAYMRGIHLYKKVLKENYQQKQAGKSTLYSDKEVSTKNQQLEQTKDMFIDWLRGNGFTNIIGRPPMEITQDGVGKLRMELTYENSYGGEQTLILNSNEIRYKV